MWIEFHYIIICIFNRFSSTYLQMCVLYSSYCAYLLWMSAVDATNRISSKSLNFIIFNFINRPGMSFLSPFHIWNNKLSSRVEREKGCSYFLCINLARLLLIRLLLKKKIVKSWVSIDRPRYKLKFHNQQLFSIPPILIFTFEKL